MSLQPWQAEHAVDEALARRLISGQFPDLADAPLARVDGGWDAEVWRCGAWAFRFPRRRVAVPLVVIEMRVLPDLAPRLPLPIPRPARLGAPSEDFPAPFYAHRYLPGSSADRLAPGDETRTALAPTLARFLAALHAIPADEARALGVPEDTFRGDTARMAERAVGRLPLLENSPWADRLPRIRTHLASPPPPSQQRHTLHGDLYARHLLLDGGAVTAVIDWGDVCVGDRALDLSLVETFLPPTAHAAFWAIYGEVDAATRERARFFGLVRYGVSLLAYALDVGDETLVAEAGRALDQTLGPG